MRFDQIKVRSAERFGLLEAIDALDVLEAVSIRRADLKRAQDVIFEYFTRRGRKRFRTVKDNVRAYVVRIHDAEQASAPRSH